MAPAGTFASSQVMLFMFPASHICCCPQLCSFLAFLTISSFPNAVYSSKPCSDGTSSMRCFWRNTLAGALKMQSLSKNAALKRERACMPDSLSVREATWPGGGAQWALDESVSKSFFSTSAPSNSGDQNRFGKKKSTDVGINKLGWNPGFPDF